MASFHQNESFPVVLCEGLASIAVCMGGLKVCLFGSKEEEGREKMF